MTQFSFEVPIQHLEDFEDLQDFHFILSMLCKNKAYHNYYYNQATKGTKQVWLDNSYNEQGKADRVIDLIKVMNSIHAHKVVIPDNPKWHIEQMLLTYKETIYCVAPSKTITVVSSSQMHEALYSIGARHFAISYHVRLPAYQTNKAINTFKWAKSFHFLGLCSIEEIRQLKPPTCDTSMPIKLAFENITTRRWFEEGYPHIHTKDVLRWFFDTKMTKRQIDLARKNIIQLKEVCNEVERH